LGFGNRLYTHEDSSRNLPQLWEWYYENPAPPTTPEALSAWGRYVRFMAEHFGDRVRYLEVWNEWNIPVYWGAEPELEHYLSVARVAIPILREVCPHAKIVLGSSAGFCYGISQWDLADLLDKRPEELGLDKPVTLFLQAVRSLIQDVDVIAWHPNYQKDPESPEFRGYADDVRAFQEYCAALGFHGEYMVTEFNYGANYPPTAPPNWWGTFQVSEMAKAKYIARFHVQHTALGVGSFVCETWTDMYPLDISLLRRTFAADPISPVQPQPAYYVTRNLATAMEDLQPATFDFDVESNVAEVEADPMRREGEKVVALWLPGRAGDSSDIHPGDVTVQGVYRKATGYDPFSGTSQVLRIKVQDGQTRLADILIRDYPVFLRLEEES
ncbi:MAG: hypothetical protein MUQ10_10335, partial [Anaerolineae bacterium]|nr:hypothetical protein [Anaerolineae bacterium]